MSASNNTSQGLYSLRGRTSDRKISRSLEATKFVFRLSQIALKLDRHLGSIAVEMPIKFETDAIIITSNIAATRLHEIWWQLNRLKDPPTLLKVTTTPATTFEKDLNPTHLCSRGFVELRIILPMLTSDSQVLVFRWGWFEQPAIFVEEGYHEYRRLKQIPLFQNNTGITLTAAYWLFLCCCI